MPTREPYYCVAFEHQAFVRFLMALGLPLAAVPVCEAGIKRLYLGVRCTDAAQAKRRTVDIVRGLLIDSPELLIGLDLGDWRARRSSRRLCLYWTGVEVEPISVH